MIAKLKYLTVFVIVTALHTNHAPAQSEGPGEHVVIAMAQHLVQDYFMHNNIGHYHIEFDLSYLHSKMRADSWTVVGSFVSDQINQNTFIAAIELICPDPDKVECWGLEKLAINGKLINVGQKL